MEKQKTVGSETLLKTLIAEGVDTIFDYPGGQTIPIYDSLYDCRDQLRHVLVRHEQGAIHAAQGYARVPDKIRVTLVTSNPGATGTITGIADTLMDNASVVIIVGQVPSPLLGTDAFQEIDVIGIAQPITKWAYRTRKPEEIMWVVSRAFYVVSTGHPGPVVPDLAEDVQVGLMDYEYKKVDYVRSYQSEPNIKKDRIKAVADLVDEAKKPFCLVGREVLPGGAEEELKALPQKSDIPAGSIVPGLSVSPTDFSLNKGTLGIHGDVRPDRKTNECNALTAIDMYFDDRVTDDLKTYAKQAKIIHLDIDNSEISKNIPVNVKVLGGAKHMTPMITTLLEEHKRPKWNAKFDWDGKGKYDKVIERELYPIRGQPKIGEVVRKVSEVTGNDATLVADVGQSRMMDVRCFKYKRTHSVITSDGLGTMGLSLPATMDAKLGAPDCTVCSFAGDGDMQMTIQELGIIIQKKLNVKIIILNNNFLGMVRQWQGLFFYERYSSTVMRNPDFVAIAKAYGTAGHAVEKRKELDDATAETLNHDGAYVLIVSVEACEMMYPMAPARENVTNMTMGDEK